MLIKLVLLFTLVPLGELMLLIEIGRVIGLWPTIGIVVVTGILGGMLLKQQGFKTWRRFKQELSSGIFPGDTILEGVLLLVGGAFLMTPGLVTDCAGFVLLTPPTRRLVLKVLKMYLKRRFNLTELVDTAAYNVEDSYSEEPPLDPSMRIR